MKSSDSKNFLSNSSKKLVKFSLNQQPTDNKNNQNNIHNQSCNLINAQNKPNNKIINSIKKIKVSDQLKMNDSTFTKFSILDSRIEKQNNASLFITNNAPDLGHNNDKIYHDNHNSLKIKFNSHSDI